MQKQSGVTLLLCLRGYRFYELVRVQVFLITHNPNMTYATSAMQDGNLPLMIFVMNNKPQLCINESPNVCIAGAAYHGHFHIVKFLFRYTTEDFRFRALMWAADHGYMHIVQWLVKSGVAVRPILLEERNRPRYSEIAQYLDQHIQ